MSALISSFSYSENLFLWSWYNTKEKWKHSFHKIAECECQHLLIFTNFKMCYEMPTTLILHNTENTWFSLFFTCIFIRVSLVKYVLVLHLCCWGKVVCLNDRVQLVFSHSFWNKLWTSKGERNGGAQNLNCVFELFSVLRKKKSISVLEIITWSCFD